MAPSLSDFDDYSQKLELYGDNLQGCISAALHGEGDPIISAVALDAVRFAAKVSEKRHLSKAQLFQDLWVLHELGDKREGWFVEFGACDGLFLSNTVLLETHYGWKGILAEPNPIFHSALLANRNCAIDFRCVSERSGEKINFRCTPNPEYSTISELSMRDAHGLTHRSDGFKDVSVSTVSLNDLLSDHNAPSVIDFMSLDTEGSELSILQGLDFDRYSFCVVTVEHNYTKSREEIAALLERNGYQRKFKDFSRFDDWYFNVAIWRDRVAASSAIRSNAKVAESLQKIAKDTLENPQSSALSSITSLTGISSISQYNDINSKRVDNDSLFFHTPVGIRQRIAESGVAFGLSSELPDDYFPSAPSNQVTGLGELEGPFPEINIQRAFRWQISPRSVIRLGCRTGGEAQLRIELGVVAENVQIEIFLNGQSLGHAMLAPPGWDYVHVLSMVVTAAQGINAVEIKASSPTVTAERSLYIAIYKVELGPPPAQFPFVDAAKVIPITLNLGEDGSGPPGQIRGASLVPAARLPADEGLDGPEGPFPEINIHRPFRWQVQPRSAFRLENGIGGEMMLNIELALLRSLPKSKWS